MTSMQELLWELVKLWAKGQPSAPARDSDSEVWGGGCELALTEPAQRSLTQMVQNEAGKVGTSGRNRKHARPHRAGGSAVLFWNRISNISGWNHNLTNPFAPEEAFPSSNRNSSPTEAHSPFFDSEWL